jgi:hypothetical protein
VMSSAAEAAGASATVAPKASVVATTLNDVAATKPLRPARVIDRRTLIVVLLHARLGHAGGNVENAHLDQAPPDDRQHHHK